MLIKRHLLSLLILLLIVNLSVFSQDTIKFKDGVTLPIESFIKSCEKSVGEEGLDSIINSHKYCNCVFMKISQNFTSKEFLELFNQLGDGMNNENKDLRAFTLFNIPKISNLIEICFTENLNLDDKDDYLEIENANQLEALVVQCKKNIFEDDDYKILAKLVDLNKYCECYVEEIFKNFTMLEITTSITKDNPKLIKIIDTCVLKNLKENDINVEKTKL